MNVAAHARAVAERWHQAVVGQDGLLERLLVAVLSGGHVLIEGVPGTAKTLAVKALARCLGLPFGRVQLTPDLLPADLLGVSVFRPDRGAFEVHPGPIFTTFLLADEINRAPARTQSALLEAMEERQVTLDGRTRPLPRHFTVFATQNPLEFEGTWPLPEAQLDRFAIQVRVPYPQPDDERRLLRRIRAGEEPADLDALALAPPEGLDLDALRAAVAAVRMQDALVDWLLALVRRTRSDGRFLLGASPRAAAALLRGAKALAALRGRDYVVPDDVLELAPDVLRHRLVLQGEAELAELTVEDVLADVLASVDVPR